MKKSLILAVAAVAATIAFASAPAQARMYNPTLNEIAPAQAQVTDIHYRSYRHSHRRSDNRWRNQRHRYRHCYNQRVRVHLPGGRIVFRTKRHCGYRWR